VTDRRVDFVLAGCRAGDPGDDIPVLPGDWRWFVDRWTGLMPSSEELSQTVGCPVKDWPLALAEQIKLAQANPTVVLVRGDPLVATPHRHLVDQLKALGQRVMVRRRLGIAELATEFAPRKPRVLTFSARESIHEHLASQDGPLLVVTDGNEQDLTVYLNSDWSHLWLSHLGSRRAFIGRYQPVSDLLSLLFTKRTALAQ
jgi:hypothetical protein